MCLAPTQERQLAAVAPLLSIVRGSCGLDELLGALQGFGGGLRDLPRLQHALAAELHLEDRHAVRLVRV
jgi:hypothetical protein